MHSHPEALCGASCAKTHFIHCLGSSYQANIRSNATLLQPHVCFLNEIVNRERSESCYITFLNKKRINSAVNYVVYSSFEGVSSNHRIIIAKLSLCLCRNKKQSKLHNTTTPHLLIEIDISYRYMVTLRNIWYSSGDIWNTYSEWQNCSHETSSRGHSSQM